MLDCEEPPRVFVFDDNGSLMALVRLIHQHQPLLRLTQTRHRVNLFAAGVKPCRWKEVVVEKKKKYRLKMPICTDMEQTFPFFWLEM